MKALLLPLFAVVALGAALASVARNTPRSEATDPPAPPPATSLASAVAGAGLIEANTENIAIGTDIAGVVSEVFVAIGGRAKRGDPLFRIDDRSARAEAGVRGAELELARARLVDAKDQFALAARVADRRAISVQELDHRRDAVAIAQAGVAQAEARLHAIETDLERLTVRAPVDGVVLQVKVRAGEYAPAGVREPPLVLFGSTEPLHVRVDVDEHEASRVRPGSKALALLRGNPRVRTPLEFVRFEPYVVPKRSLTGDTTERVDTRVLQVIYRFDRGELPLFVGQQMDVFIEAPAAEERRP